MAKELKKAAPAAKPVAKPTPKAPAAPVKKSVKK